MDKQVKQKQTANKKAMAVKETKTVEPVKAKEVIVEAPSKVELKQAELKPKKKRHRKPAKKAPAAPAIPIKKLNWLQKLWQTILKWA